MKKLFLFLVLVIFLIGCSKTPTGSVTIEPRINEGQIASFKMTKDPVCFSNGKPVVRLFATSWCPHCNWIKTTFDKVMNEYVAAGKISAHHWIVDVGDDALTASKESIIPPDEMGIYKRYNPDGSVPTFVFACKYVRIGNAYETQNNLKAEEAEFRAVLEEILKK